MWQGGKPRNQVNFLQFRAMATAFPSQLPDRKDVFCVSHYLPQGSIALHFLSDVYRWSGENYWDPGSALIPKSSHLLTAYLLLSPTLRTPVHFQISISEMLKGGQTNNLNSHLNRYTQRREGSELSHKGDKQWGLLGWCGVHWTVNTPPISHEIIDCPRLNKQHILTILNH